ncbi:hypothetical protein HF086_004377 [Spodoptera exigua]|uniref:Uncharacterized protein n=1 Tax=Spodoptera exigua TaxID=7107 RepID=A0A922MEA5_SPOEX|nr:hypothetical protein HF086_004377 [Spodoptera exigua]
MTIVDLSKTLTSLMLEAQQRVERYGTSDVITVETINGWAELYQELVNCCDKVAVCFGYQTREYQSIIKLLLLIIGYMIVVILPVVATQMASDQWAKCQRVMARLHNTMIDGNTMADDVISNTHCGYMKALFHMIKGGLLYQLNTFSFRCWCSRKEVGKAIFTCDQEASATDQVYD